MSTGVAMGSERVNIAVRLVEERTRLGFSQRDFAAKLGVSAEGLRLYETGQRGVSGEFLAHAATLGLDVQYVLTGVESANRTEVERAVQPAVAIQSSTNVIGVMNGGTVHQIKTEKVNHITKAEVKPGDEHISEGQAAKLTELVNEIVEIEAKLKKAPKTHRAVWGALNAHMGVTRYRLIPLIGFEKAEKYLRQWIGRLNSMASAPTKDGDAWRKRKYAYIKINSKDDPSSIDLYIARNFKATSLTELSNDELEQVYRYVAGRKRGRGKR
jgi:transcriptional regulator with XRE-family HTH domain